MGAKPCRGLRRPVYGTDIDCPVRAAQTWRARVGIIRRSRFGDVALVAFLLAQASDGVLDLRRRQHLRRSDGRQSAPRLADDGDGTRVALTAAKAAAGAFGIALHLTSVHRVVALLAALYVAAAVVPWIGVLFY